MMQKDLFNDIEVRACLASITGGTGDTAFVGAIIDHSGFESLVYAINLGTMTDADVTFVVLVEHGDASNLSDAAAVPDEFLLGTELGAGFRFDDDGETRKIGYKGGKRYSRVTITPTGNTGNIPIGIVAILGHPRKAPITSQG